VSAVLTLASRDHETQVDTLVAAFHKEAGIALSDGARSQGITTLLEGSPHGVIYLIGPARAPIGYIVITFGWSLEFGGLDGFVDEVYVRPGVRGRGIASEVLQALPRALAGVGLKALHLEVDRSSEARQKLYARAGFKPRPDYILMTRSF
jgi:ribosomal protein S18 acetylase RimI-like enzyme